MRLSLLGFAVTAPSGFPLACVRIRDYAQNPAFLVKMAILLAAGTNALLLRLASRSSQIAHVAGRSAGWIAAAFSLCLWVSAVFAGRWIAFQ